MNNYKFRGKTANNWPGEWVYGFLVKDYRQSYIYNGDNGDFSDCGGVPIDDLHSVIPETVGQWTGIKDNSGKEIYDGDIVRVKTRHGTIVSSICYFNDFSMFAVKEVALYYRQYPTNRPLGSSGSSTSYRPYNWNSYFSVEVIGNIHDNPELLEDK